MIAIRIFGTSEKYAPLFGHALDKFTAAIRLGTGHTSWHRLRIAAFGKSFTGQKFSEPPPFDNHGFPAKFAFIVGRNRLASYVFHLFTGRLDVFGKRPVKIPQDMDPFHLAV